MARDKKIFLKSFKKRLLKSQIESRFRLHMNELEVVYLYSV